MRESWTDERLDDFRGDVDRRFDEVDRRFDTVDKRFDRVEDRMEKGFAEVNDRFDRLQQTLIRGGIALSIGLLGVLCAMLGLIAAKL